MAEIRAFAKRVYNQITFMVNNQVKQISAEKLFCQSTNQGMLLFQDSGCVYRDLKAYEILGYKKEYVDKIPVNKLVQELVHPDDQEMVRRIAGKLYPNSIDPLNHAKKIKIRVLTAKNEEKWLEVVVKNIIFNGKPTAQLLITDIDKSKKMEEKLSQSEKMYQTIFDSTSGGIILSDADTTIKYANRRFAQIVGVPKRKIEGKMSWVGFMSENDRVKMLKYHEWRRTKQHHAPTNYEFSLIDKHGDLRRCLATITMIPQTDWSIASFLDITERTKAESEVRQQKAQFRSAFYKAPVSIMLVNKGGIVQEANKTCLRLFELTNKEIQQKKIRDLVSKKLLPKEFLEFCHSRGRHAASEVFFTTRLGKKMWLQMICSKMSQNGNNPNRLVMIQDLTDTIVARKIIMDLPSRLLQAHEDEKQLLSQEIHDTFSQSLAALKLSIQAQKPIDDILGQVNSLIDMSRSFSHNLRPEIIDKLGLLSALKNLVEEMSVRFGSQIKIKTNIRQIKVTPEVSLQLFRITQESIVNAIKHSQATAISVTLNKHGRTLSIIIRDNGKGFDIKSIQHTTDHQKSLGLKIIIERANRIHAACTIKSTIGRGTIIVVDYPTKKVLPIN